MSQRPRSVKLRSKGHIAAPRMWPTWLLVGCAWCIAHLPMRAIFVLGQWVGVAMFHLARGRRHVTLTNLRLCFPELDEPEVQQMARRVFQEVAIGALELMVPWLNPGRDLSARMEIEGLSHLQAALAAERGVILVGGHFAVMDVISQGLSQCGPIDVMYRFNKNPVWEWLQVQGRRRYFDGVIERQDTRDVLRRLRRGRAIWYATDQDYGAKHSVFAPFFGIETATIVATSRFARLNNSPVLTLQQTRDRARGVWRIKFHPVLENFPSGDDAADAARLNAQLEVMVRENPEQYLWLHKRFKTRPPGEASLYKRKTD